MPRDHARRPRLVERPLDVVALELLVTISQALLAGILLTLAHDLGGDARSAGLPVPGLLAVLAIAILVAWGIWLAGLGGIPMLALGVGAAVLTGALWLLALGDASVPRIDPLMGILAFACAVLGIGAGAFLPGPRRSHWKGGTSRPQRGLPDTRTTPARFSPPVQRVVDERLSTLSRPHLPHLPHVALPARRPSTDPAEPDDDEAADEAADVPALPAPPSLAPRSGPAIATAPDARAMSAAPQHSPTIVLPDAPTVPFRLPVEPDDALPTAQGTSLDDAPTEVVRSAHVPTADPDDH